MDATPPLDETFDETFVRCVSADGAELRLPTRLYRSEHVGGFVLVLAHGAGAPQAHPFMVRVASAMARAGVSVRTFDFPYVVEGRRAPDRLPRLVEAFRAVVEDTEEKVGGALFVGGKSMGSRAAAELCRARAEPPRGLVCFGYPLSPRERPAQEASREALLRAVPAPVPMYFAHGTRDPFASEARMRELAAALGPRATLDIVPGGDHSLEVTRAEARGRSREQVWAEVGARAAAWVHAHGGAGAE
ncbi:MAG: hypothetical protein IPF92_06865 [Myxococcales bacterium]|nr:hypothetical protein [Myxococcales bacterium]MBL0192761.1 hypothetical protein [Myxococcales bacterium]HQY62522.1 hypothetical protein [Polyangiaceae bacterium]